MFLHKNNCRTKLCSIQSQPKKVVGVVVVPIAVVFVVLGVVVAILLVTET